MTIHLLKFPFSHHFVNFRNSESKTSLHFALGGATQHGSEHIKGSYNNQDATSILIDNEFLLGILCDGCSSTHDNLRNTYSNNEVGAKLLAYIFANNLKKLLKEKKLKNDPCKFLKDLFYETSHRFISFINVIVEDDENERETFIFDFLMSTILGFVVTQENYLVFACGDGIIAINSQIIVLKEEGSYFAKSILPECCPSLFKKASDSNTLKIVEYGRTSELQNIFLASDGFIEIVQKYNKSLVDFINSPTTTSINGFDYSILPNFRKEILKQKEIEEYCSNLSWPRDDSSFILLKKIQNNISSNVDFTMNYTMKECQNDSTE